MNSDNRGTKRSRHISQRMFYARQEKMKGYLDILHARQEYSIGDLGTKNLTAEDAAYKLSIVEVPVTDQSIGASQTTRQTPTEEGW